MLETWIPILHPWARLLNVFQPFKASRLVNTASIVLRLLLPKAKASQCCLPTTGAFFVSCGIQPMVEFLNREGPLGSLGA